MPGRCVLARAVLLVLLAAALGSPGAPVITRAVTTAVLLLYSIDIDL